ncbi:10186_t:CDS:1, partial [Entrophospora sp. SA101]
MGEFNPEQFLNDDNNKKDTLIFGGGSRICPGRILAINQMK